MTLSKELIEDFKNNVMIVDLCKKYGLTYFIVRNGLKKLGLINKEKSWGGKRQNCGRKKIEKDNELERIRKRNAKMSFEKQPEGSRANPRFQECRHYNNDFYKGGW